MNKHIHELPPRTRINITFLSLAFLLCMGCAAQLEDVSAEGHHEELSWLYSSDVILDWNDHALNAMIEDNGYTDPLMATRVFTLVHLSMHDAVNATRWRAFRSYAFKQRDPLAHPVAAAAGAAYHVLVSLFPTQENALREKLEASLQDVPDGRSERRGVRLGERVAHTLLDLRAKDGSDQSEPYTPGELPGQYQFTTPDFIYGSGWQNVTPWALESADQYRSDPPPPLDSTAYATDYDEVMRMGDVNSTTRSDDETAYAQFWYELSDVGWNRVTRVVAQQESLDLVGAARLFALVNMAMADGYIAGWDSKFFYDFWRPITAISRGDTDGNPATVADSNWTSFLPTPPVQDHPSTHSTLGAAVAEVLTRYFGQRGDDIGFSMTSPTASNPNVEVRSFLNFKAAAAENADSRVMAGLHFRFACDAGLDLGEQIGTHVFENYLTPIRNSRRLHRLPAPGKR